MLKPLFSILLIHYAFIANAEEFSGNIKAYGISRDYPQFDSPEYTLQLSSKMQVITSLSEKTNWEIAYEILTFTEKPKIHSNQKTDYRVKDFKPYLHDERPDRDYHTLVSHNLNRFNINSSFENFDISVGRMPIAFGSSKSINPTDVLVPFAINTIDKEERTGVDTVQLKIPFSALSLLEMGIITGEDFEKKKSAFYLRPRFNFNELEVIFTVMRFKELDLIGLDFQHPLSEAGFWFESAFIDQPKKPISSDDFFRVTTGIDYKFVSTLYLSGEYHFNGASGNNTLLNPLEFIYLRNEHYFIATGTYEFTPLITGSVQTYFNKKDKSTLSLIKAEYNFKENAYLNLGSFYSTGNKYKTEFASLGKTLYTALRYYY